MKKAADFVGQLQLRPGHARPGAVSNSRRPLASQLLLGQPAERVPRLLASLFTLCGHAHALCAQLALAAARGQTATASIAQQRALQAETARDHALRIALDWPSLLSTGPATARVDGPTTALIASLSTDNDDDSFSASACESLQQWLALPPAVWLSEWEQAPSPWLHHWSQQHHGTLPALMRNCRPMADYPLQASPALRPHASETTLRAFAQSMTLEFNACTPNWQGQCAETGTWTRLKLGESSPPASAWERLGARIAELARLVLPDTDGRTGRHWLASGALQTAPDESIAWVEMGRGLLIHRVRLDSATTRVASYDVLAPTDWNFHPQGAVARALEAMPAHAPHTPGRTHGLIAAYDPCVPFEIVTSTATEETLHA